jgi:hypothetical protein
VVLLHAPTQLNKLLELFRNLEALHGFSFRACKSFFLMMRKFQQMVVEELGQKVVKVFPSVLLSSLFETTTQTGH